MRGTLCSPQLASSLTTLRTDSPTYAGVMVNISCSFVKPIEHQCGKLNISTFSCREPMPITLNFGKASVSSELLSPGAFLPVNNKSPNVFFLKVAFKDFSRQVF